MPDTQKQSTTPALSCALEFITDTPQLDGDLPSPRCWGMCIFRLLRVFEAPLSTSVCFPPLDPVCNSGIDISRTLYPWLRLTLASMSCALNTYSQQD